MKFFFFFFLLFFSFFLLFYLFILWWLNQFVQVEGRKKGLYMSSRPGQWNCSWFLKVDKLGVKTLFLNFNVDRCTENVSKLIWKIVENDWLTKKWAKKFWKKYVVLNLILKKSTIGRYMRSNFNSYNFLQKKSVDLIFIYISWS